MGVNHLHLIGGHVGVFQRQQHAATGAVGVGRRDMPGVTAHAETDELGVNSGAALDCKVVVFQHHHARAFPEHETIAVFVPRAACAGRIVIASGQSAR